MARRRRHAARKALTACPRCGGAGRSVGRVTLQAILKPEATLRLLAFKPRFCRSRACDVLYYGADGRVVEKRDSTVPVGIKETEDLALLCYCLGITRSDIRHEVEDTGSSDAPSRVLATIRANRSACEVKNPSGTFCLGDVKEAVREAQESTSTARAQNTEPCWSEPQPERTGVIVSGGNPTGGGLSPTVNCRTDKGRR